MAILNTTRRIRGLFELSEKVHDQTYTFTIEMAVK
jgi:hypothetical protein